MTTPQKPVDLSGLSVLLAEDAPFCQKLVSHALARAGADLTIAENGRVAARLALMAHHIGDPFHVILMDVQMPERDGLQTIKMLRERGYRAPIVGFSASESRRACEAAGCDGFIGKPVKPGEILRQLARFRPA